MKIKRKTSLIPLKTFNGELKRSKPPMSLAFWIYRRVSCLQTLDVSFHYGSFTTYIRVVGTQKAFPREETKSFTMALSV